MLPGRLLLDLLDLLDRQRGCARRRFNVSGSPMHVNERGRDRMSNHAESAAASLDMYSWWTWTRQVTDCAWLAQIEEL